MNKKAIFLKVENPCTEQWNSMNVSENGRYCMACEKVVIDMTTWSDQQFIDFFNRNTGAVCGRVKRHKTNQWIQGYTPPVKSTRYKYKKLLAFLISCFSLSMNSLAFGTNKKNYSEQMEPQQKDFAGTTFLITGNVKGLQYENLEGVKINFDGKDYFTDSLGNFEIMVDSITAKSTILVFNYGNLMQEVRNYNPAMGSTFYQVNMQNPPSGYAVVMGGIGASFYIPEADTTQYVQLNKNILTKNNKTKLDSFAEILRQNPNAIIHLQTYYKSEKKQAISKGHLVKKYLVEIQGIDSERLYVVEPIKTKIDKELDKVYFRTSTDY